MASGILREEIAEVAQHRDIAAIERLAVDAARHASAAAAC
jgi:hypothetical protein